MTENFYIYRPTQDWDSPFSLLIDDEILYVVKVNWYKVGEGYLISIVSEYSDPYDKATVSEEEATKLFLSIVRRPYVNKSIIEELGFTIWEHPGG